MSAATKTRRRDTFVLSKSLQLPDTAVTEVIGIIAKRGAGKTYTATKLAEEMLDASHQVIALDPVGVWYGLQFAADGKRAGFDIPVIGGLHGNLPLEPEAGALIANVIADHHTSAVIDVSMFNKSQMKRFATDFAETLLHRKKNSRTPLHLFLEEAQEFIPQKAYKGSERMLGAFESLVKLGRNFGIGCTLITQRPQAVNKDALNQAELLIVLQMVGPQERKAIAAWVSEKGAEESLLAELPRLKIGQAVVWSPSWLHVLDTIHIDKKRTLDASATPTRSKSAKITPRPLNITAIKTAMKDLVTRADENDPAKLKKRIAELEKQLTIKGTPAGDVESKRKLQEMSRALMKAQAQVEKVIALVTKRFGEIEQLSKKAHKEASQIDIVATPEGIEALTTPTQVTSKPRSIATNVLPVGARSKTRATTDVPQVLAGAAHAILRELARFYPKSLTRGQLSIFTSYSNRSSSFGGALANLRSRHLIEGNDRFRLTEAGRQACVGEVFERPKPGAELINFWRDKLPTHARAMFDVLVARYPTEIDRHTLAEEAGYSPTSSTLSSAIGLLTGLELVTPAQGGLRASDSLFKDET